MLRQTRTFLIKGEYADTAFATQRTVAADDIHQAMDIFETFFKNINGNNRCPTILSVEHTGSILVDAAA